MERQYPRIRITGIECKSHEIIISAISIQNRGRAKFQYKACGESNYKHTRELIQTRTTQSKYRLRIENRV